MKVFNSLLFLIFITSVTGQDTTFLYNYGDGGFKMEIRNGKDTLIKSFYSRDKVESTIKRNLTTNKLDYKRYYWSGKIMWDKEMSGNEEDGICTYYSSKGSKVAKFTYSKGKIVDTLFLAKNTYLILGNALFSSTIYGGMENEDGTSNVSHIEGPSQHLTMKFVTIKKKETDKLQQYMFTSDHLGDFFVVIQPGSFGLFNQNRKLNTISIDQFIEIDETYMSASSSWSLTGPIVIKKEEHITPLTIKNSFVGYAP